MNGFEMHGFDTELKCVVDAVDWITGYNIIKVEEHKELQCLKCSVCDQDSKFLNIFMIESGHWTLYIDFYFTEMHINVIGRKPSSDYDTCCRILKEMQKALIRFNEGEYIMSIARRICARNCLESQTMMYKLIMDADTHFCNKVFLQMNIDPKDEAVCKEVMESISETFKGRQEFKKRLQSIKFMLELIRDSTD